MSTQLSSSYSMLEARVKRAQGPVTLVSAQRMELAEKERLANRLQSLLDLPGGVIVIDGQGVVREAIRWRAACSASRWWACLARGDRAQLRPARG